MTTTTTAPPEGGIDPNEVGSLLPSVSLIDGWGRSTSTASFAGRPLLLFYEDRESSNRSAALKADLSRLSVARPKDLPLRVVPIADLCQLDFWPVRDLLRAYVRTESKKHGIQVFVDFDGTTAEALAARHGESTICVYGADSRLVLRRCGSLSAADRAAVIEAVVEVTS